MKRKAHLQTYGILATLIGFAHVALALESYDLNKVPELTAMRWGMSVQELKQLGSFSSIEASSGNYASQGLYQDKPSHYQFVFIEDGLQVIAIQVDLSMDEQQVLLRNFRQWYGNPTAIDAQRGIHQWKDGFQEAAITLGAAGAPTHIGFRNIPQSRAGCPYTPDKWSVLQGIWLGMSEEELKTNYKFSPLGNKTKDSYFTEIFFNHERGTAAFNFDEQGRLGGITVLVPIEGNDQQAMLKGFQEHLAFLVEKYGQPTETKMERLTATWHHGGKEELVFAVLKPQEKPAYFFLIRPHSEPPL